MKTVILTAIAAVVTLTSVTAEARRNCPGGQGYWDVEVRNVRVCDTETQTYTETKRHCGYQGTIWLGHLWNQPDFPLPMTRYVTGNSVLDESKSCPGSQYKHETGTYWYTKPDGFKTIDWYKYTGSIGLTSNQLKTSTHTRTVETNCRTEQKVTRVFRCGHQP